MTVQDNHEVQNRPDHDALDISRNHTTERKHEVVVTVAVVAKRWYKMNND